MFTGIISAVGHIQSLEKRGDDMRVTVAVGKLPMHDVALGDSIATNGVCLTVVDYSSTHYSADVSAETLRYTGFADYRVGSRVNLEKALAANGRLGGHIVSGHVDGVGTVTRVIDHTKYVEIWVKAPDSLAKYIAHKGSITTDGVSLTVNQVNGAEFMLWVIPHTLEETVIGDYKVGTKINLEVDLIARYLERLLQGEHAAKPTGSSIDEAFLAEHGFLNKK
ncbi:riboflavin synthase [Alteromonas oceanisediminis]|uniref:riboflavin synthase n=1 Tax=Alteromonas oceanisediminis TaxID=2836180 RepID=UPI001BDB5770|nr:riboflavin synthase [Alteromonas oceanisediminis]MBT0585816.1 riboflavin synthase [Alteromonas oceanisediminis]